MFQSRVNHEHGRPRLETICDDLLDRDTNVVVVVACSQVTFETPGSPRPTILRRDFGYRDL